MKKNNVIGVFFGGKSPEHDVSIITGQLVINELKKIGYQVVPIYIDSKGSWYLNEQLGSLKFFTAKDASEKLKQLTKFKLLTPNGNQNMTFVSSGLFSKKYVIDLAFPALHGQNGEDGTIQGLFEIYGIPYVGCDVAALAITMDKVLTKQLYTANNIKTTDFISINYQTWEQDKKHVHKEIENKLKMPIFIKPAKAGSSVGITKVKTKKQIDDACDLAFHYGPKIIIENAVENVMDITCAILSEGEDIQVSLIQEVEFDNDLFSFEDKYIEDGGGQFGNSNKLVIPARIDSSTTKSIQQLAIKVYKNFELEGTARIDLLFNKKTKEVYVNEINPMPGTLYHHLWKKSGISVSHVLEKLIASAKLRVNLKEKFSFEYKNDLLDFANSVKLQINETES